ncbi:NUDIX domain-containing protein [Herbidospora sp. NEAU-GS84]|uniref:NUDIX domain-containing protein n=1 Tax=Herbidospora solisilvae TaxID=2696284 RepID=A0A7C9NDR8_9ACTN|nr:NUDIX domain-containing protein [Herbidospora solisilvae]NAS22135.1 NUDIX domain-containing protein [Herbidospora solisilvae]
MTAKDGDGWTHCGRGHRHWGVYGASGLLAVHHTARASYVLMQKRALWSHHGGTWGLPGGAIDSHEDAVTGALREAHEETALSRDALRVRGVYLDDHGGWSYQTVIATAVEKLPVHLDMESTALRWVTLAELPRRRLHPGFAETWPVVSEMLKPLVVVVDAANVIGARAEHGWWRDRAGATSRLLAELVELAVDGVIAPIEGLPLLTRRFPQVVVVVEGAARGARVPEGLIDVRAAEGSGDDAIVEVVREARVWETVLVVTADRGLRERVRAEGALVTGPKWLLGQLS